MEENRLALPMAHVSFRSVFSPEDQILTTAPPFEAEFIDLEASEEERRSRFGLWADKVIEFRHRAYEDLPNLHPTVRVFEAWNASIRASIESVPLRVRQQLIEVLVPHLFAMAARTKFQDYLVIEVRRPRGQGTPSEAGGYVQFKAGLGRDYLYGESESALYKEKGGGFLLEDHQGAAQALGWASHDLVCNDFGIFELASLASYGLLAELVVDSLILLRGLGPGCSVSVSAVDADGSLGLDWTTDLPKWEVSLI